VEDEEEDESERSGTVNARSPGRATAAFRDEDSQDEDFQEEDSHIDTHSEVSETMDVMDSTRPIPRARDEDDDESTTGYDNTYTETGASDTLPGESRRSRLWLIALVMLLLVGAGAAAWLLLFAPPSEPAPPPETRAAVSPPPKAGDSPTAVGAMAHEDPHPAGSTGAPASPPPEPGTATAPSAPTPVEGSAASPSAAGVVEPAPAVPPPEPEPPAEVLVEFRAPARTALKVGGRVVKLNTSLSLAPGVIQVDYRCQGARGYRTRKFSVPENPASTVIFKLNNQDCRRQKSRR
jgi:hypothetical protein